MSTDITFEDIAKIKKVFEQKGIPLDEISTVFLDGIPYYMWPVEKALKHKTIDTYGQQGVCTDSLMDA
jgi:hypothetical protein